MKKSELQRQILDSFSSEEWAAMEEDRVTVPLREYNRQVLLELRAKEEGFPGEAEDARIHSLRSHLERFLARYWAEEPGAHKYVIQVCLALSLLYEKPMHPPASVGYRSLVEKGRIRYFCPAREEGEDSLCLFCPTESMSVLEERWEALSAEAARREGKTSAMVRLAAYRAGFQDAGALDTAALRFHPEVRATCEGNRCRGYGSSWACPPAVGTLEECRERVLGFGKLMLVSKAYLLEDGMDFAGVGAAMGDFKTCALELGKALRPRLKKLLILSNEGCGRCRTCTWPEEACRFPEELQPSIEGFGFIVSELAKQAGIPYLNGKDTVTFFGAVLYDEDAPARQEE